MPQISASRRLRRTPFSDGVEAAGVKGYTVYNRMLLPTVFESVEADYRHLKSHVQVWDVACERQIELLSGLDAEGNPISQPFDDQATLSRDDEPQRAARPPAERDL